MNPHAFLALSALLMNGFMLLSHPANATNGTDRGGGDLTGNEVIARVNQHRRTLLPLMTRYRDLALRQGLESVGSSFSSLLELLNPNSLPAVEISPSEKPLLLDGRTVDAISYPDLKKSEYGIRRFSALSPCRQITLVLHEFHILARLEPSLDLRTSANFTQNLDVCKKEREQEGASPLPCNGAPGYPHPNGGGFVAHTAYVDSDSSVARHAQVCDDATVWNSSIELKGIVEGETTIRQSRVSGLVSGNASVTDSSVTGQIGGHATAISSQILDDAQVFGSARLYDARILSRARVGGEKTYISHATITGNASVMDRATVISDRSHPTVTAWIGGDTRISGDALVSSYVVGDIEISGSTVVAYSTLEGNVKVLDHAQVFASHLSGEARLKDHAWVNECILGEKTIVGLEEHLENQITPALKIHN